MQDKQKVTVYLPPGLHRQLKIRAAIDLESMSVLVEKAIAFYLKHPEQVEQTEATYGKTHQIHVCPECDAAMVMRENQMVSLKSQAALVDEEFPLEVSSPQSSSQGEEELVPC
ncbi:MAG: hypothetical protein ACFB4I_24920 [Cyanophyceae cyanobacterium]